MAHFKNKFDDIVQAINDNNKALAKQLAEDGRDNLCPQATAAFDEVKQKLLDAGVDPPLLVNMQNVMNEYF